jgi:FAD/FMN-containing dehydrogenase
MAAAEIVDLSRPGDWTNYHDTGTSRLKARWALRSGDAGRGREELAQASAAVQDWLNKAKQQNIPVRPVGGAWSPSNIQLVQDGWLLHTRRFNRCFRLSASDFERPPMDPAAYLLIEGGVQIDEINDKLEEIERSLVTTGASNGQTLAGACATGTHGSVPTAGGIQQHIRAIQIVTPAGVHWIEAAAGLMSTSFVNETGSTLMRDDEAFQACLVPVGSLGIVTAIVIETVPIYLVRPYLKLIDLREEDVEMLQEGEFRAFSEKHGATGLDPYFVMVITNPFRPFRHKATVKFLYKCPWQENYKRQTPAALGAGYDAQTMTAWALHNFPWARGWILQTIMQLAIGKGVTGEVYGTWGETTETHFQLAKSFAAAMFSDRSHLVRTFELLCSAFSRGGGSTAVTMRFLKGGPGLLSQARWPDTVGIDCDGPDSRVTERAYLRMLAELDNANIPFTLHWGKFGNFDAARIARGYGNEFVRWKAVQAKLLATTDDRRLFRSAQLDRLGLTS